MSIQHAAHRWTYEAFARLPDDGQRYEVIGGELFVTPAPKPIHAKIATRISRVLEEFVETHALGEVFGHAIDIVFGEGDYLEPDLLFVSRERMSIVTDRGVEAAPDLVVEVLSPTTAARDRRLKRERYAFFGVREYWLVDPVARRFEIYRQTDVGSHDATITTESFQWQPVKDGPVLTLNVPDLLRDMISADEPVHPTDQ